MVRQGAPYGGESARKADFYPQAVRVFFGVVQVECRAVFVAQAFDDGKAEAGVFFVAAEFAVEGVEDARAFVGGDAGAVVFDDEGDGVGGNGEVEVNAAAGRAVAQGVVGEVFAEGVEFGGGQGQGRVGVGGDAEVAVFAVGERQQGFDEAAAKQIILGGNHVE